MGTVYLLHFDQPYKHARHYIGWTPNLRRRLAEHEKGRGARLIAVIMAAGITWQLARTWNAGRVFERRLKCHGATRICPICSPGTLGPTPGIAITRRPAVLTPRCGRELREIPRRASEPMAMPICGRPKDHPGGCLSVTAYRHQLDLQNTTRKAARNA